MLAIKSMFWIFVLIAALAAVGIFVAKSQEPTQQQEQTEQKPNDTQQDPSPSADKNEQEQTQGWAKYKQGIAYYWKRFFEFSERWHDAIIAIGTAFIAAFTGLLFVATILLWWGGERSSYRQLRAYVSVTANYVYAFGPQTPSQIRFAMTNHGQTPAYKTSSSAAVDILPFPLPKGFKLPIDTNPAPSSFVLHPQASFAGNVVAKRTFTSAEIADAVANNGKRIYVYGTVKYEDLAGDQRFTDFCYSVIGDQNLAAVSGGTPIPTVDIKFSPAEDFNQAN
jgi:hypothetical protein